MNPLEDAVAKLLAIAAGLDGIVAAYGEPPLEPNDMAFPFALVYISSGEMTPISAGLVRGIHTVVLEIHQSRTVVPKALVAVQVWPDRVLRALHSDTTLASVPAMVRWPVTYTASILPYVEGDHYGIRFNVPLKVH